MQVDLKAQLALYTAVVRFWDLDASAVVDADDAKAGWLDLQLKAGKLDASEVRRLVFTRWAPAYAAERGRCPWCGKSNHCCPTEEA